MSDVVDGWPDPSFGHVAKSCKIAGTYWGEPRAFVGRVYRIDDAGTCDARSEEFYAIKNAMVDNVTRCVKMAQCAIRP